MSYFYETHQNTLDDKGRLVIPAAFRRDAPPEILAADMMVTPHKEGYLEVRPDEEWQKYIEFVKQQPVSAKVKREYLRALYSTSQRVRIDRQNRLMLSPRLRKVVTGTEDPGKAEVILLGAGTYFEIRPTDSFEGEDAMIEKVTDLRDQVEEAIGEGFFG